MSLTATEWDILAPVRQQLARAKHGQQGAIVAAAARALGCSVQTVYRKLEKAGQDSGRKQRADAGTSTMPLAELRLVASTILASQRDSGKTLLTVADALDILRASGQITSTLSPSQVTRLLEAQGMHPRQLAAPEPSVRLRSLHPNHVWQMDSSVCVLYYLPGGQLRSMDADVFYRNKPANAVRAFKDLVTRYIITDHCSGTIADPVYYLGTESAAVAVDYLVRTIWGSDGLPFKGVPRVLMLDPGPGNTSRLMATGLKALGITPSIHKPRAARVNGQVEKSHDIVERHFEGLLRFVDREAINLDALNDMAARWARAFNAAKRHSRHGQPRYSVWMRITPEQLRLPASLADLRNAFTHEPESRQVKNDLTITMNGRWYDVRRVPGIAVGQSVLVALNPFRAPAVDVRSVDVDTGEEHWHTIEPTLMDANGFPLSAPVIGEEHHQAAPHSRQDAERARALQEAYRTGAHLPTQEEAAKARKAHAQAFAGRIDPMAHVDATPVPAYLPRRSTEVELAQRNVHAPTLSTVEAAKLLRDRMGDAYTPQVYQHLAQHHPSGVTQAQLQEVQDLFTTPPATATPGQADGTTGLRLITGGH